MHSKSIRELINGLRNKAFSSEELTRTFLDRIKKFDPELNSFITITEEKALQQARLADKRLSENKATALTGIPIAHKDNFCTLGIKTSCASKMLDNFIAPYDATLISQFNQAGTILLGKTNMDEFAMGSSNENSFYGPVRNPWQKEYVPGGSSGGSATAVAARLAPASTGTDTGGSIRQPAALCGLTGLKPTYGRVSRFGLVAFASSLDQAGPMARSAEDCAYLLQVMAGFDEKDSTSINADVPDYLAQLDHSLNGLKIGLPKEFFDEGLHPEIVAATEKAIQELTQLGATIHDISLPNMRFAVPAYYVIAPAEASSNLARFDGVRYGYRCQNPVDLEDMYKRSRGEGFGSEVKRRIMVGTYVLSAGYYNAFYTQALKIRRLIKDDFERVFDQVDVILGPTTPHPAFKLGEKKTDPVSMYLEDIYTIPVNLAGLPAISVPTGTAENKPIGLQLIGNYLQEGKLLNIAHQFQQVTDWHRHCPKEYL